MRLSHRLLLGLVGLLCLVVHTSTEQIESTVDLESEVELEGPMCGQQRCPLASGVCCAGAGKQLCCPFGYECTATIEGCAPKRHKGLSEDSKNVFDQVRDSIREANVVPGSVDKLNTLLLRIKTRLSFEQQMADVHYNTVYRFYDTKTANASLTQQRYLETLDKIKRRLGTLAFDKENLQRHLSTLDVRIRTHANKIGVQEDKVSAGEARRSRETAYFQNRLTATKAEIVATNHVIDKIGSTKAASPSLKEALNAAFKPDAKDPAVTSVPTPGAAKPPAANATAAPAPAKPPAPPKASVVDALATSFLEVQGLDDLDYVKDLLRAMYQNLHNYLRLLTTEEAQRANEWATHKYYFRNITARHQFHIDKLESTRIPSHKKLNSTIAEWNELPRTQWFVQRKLKAVSTSIQRYRNALQGLKEDYEMQKTYRGRQLETTEQLLKLVDSHVGDVPFRAKEAEAIVKEAEPIFAGSPFLGLRAMEDPSSDDERRRQITNSKTLPKHQDDKVVDQDNIGNKRIK